VAGKAQALAQPAHVRVDDDPRDAVVPAQDDVGGLPADAGERDQLLHGAGDAAAEPLQQRPAHGLEGPPLLAEEPRGADERLQLLRVGAREVLRRAEAREKLRGDTVDHGVGALGGEDGGDEQLEGVAVAQGNAGLRVALGQPGDDPPDAAPRRGRRLAGRELWVGGGHVSMLPRVHS
jgi:hypothetical protein